MDKLLATKFVLRGGRDPNAGVLVNPESEKSCTDGSADTTVIPGVRPPRLFNSDPDGCTRYDADNTCGVTKPSETPCAERNQFNSRFSGERPAAQAAAAAYYVEPGSKVMPVDILSEQWRPHISTGVGSRTIGSEATQPREEPEPSPIELPTSSGGARNTPPQEHERASSPKRWKNITS